MNFLRRRPKRARTLNPLRFTVLGVDGAPQAGAKGRALSVSGAGLLLSSSVPLKIGRDLLITITLDGERAEIKGHVVHCEPAGDGCFWAGIEFASVDGERRRVLENYMKIFPSSS